MSDESPPPEPIDRRPWKADAAWLTLMAALFLAWHIPLMYRTAPGLDEDLFAVPGTTILRTGRPQIPYIPTRDLSTYLYKVDVTLYFLPPLSFYLQAATHALLGNGIGPARMTSALEGLAAALLVYALARRWLLDRRAPLWAAMLYLFGRAAFFPATTARPDMAATAFGLLAVWLSTLATGEARRRGIIASGVAGGLSVLCHPIGVVPCAQVALWQLAEQGTWRMRFSSILLFTASALLAFSLWGILIARAPTLFWLQFHGNVLGDAGSGLSATLRNPLPILGLQARQFVMRVLPIQAVLYALGALWCLATSRSDPRSRSLAYHFCTSFLLLFLFMGRHEALSYFAYPAAFACIAASGFASATAPVLARLVRRPRLATLLMTALLIASLVPGAGLKTIVVHLQHWNDPAYDARRVAQRIMHDLDPNLLVAADGAYVLDFYLSGRRVVAAHQLEYLEAPYDVLVVGPDGLRMSKIPRESLELVARYGDRKDPFAPYAEVFRPIGPGSRRTPPPSSPAPKLDPKPHKQQ